MRSSNVIVRSFLTRDFNSSAGYFLRAVFGEKFLSQLAERFDAAAGADTDVDLLIADFLRQPSLSGIDIFGDELVESFLAGFFIENFKQAHTAHRVALGAKNGRVVRQNNFDAASADVDQQCHLALEVDRLFHRQMNQTRLFLAADDRDFDSGRLATAFKTVSRFDASRKALVPTALTCVTACSFIFCLKSVNVCNCDRWSHPR